MTDVRVERPEATDDVLSGVLDGLRSVYQPIVDLASGAVVGYEALARGPEGPLANPTAMFAHARDNGRLVALDRACRSAAVHGAAEAGVHGPATLFVNVEPEALACEDPASLLHDVSHPHDDGAELPVVLEITERALAARPAELLQTVERARQLGWRVALDDVGVDRASLTFLPLLCPDIVKLDMSLVQRRANAAVAETMHAVNAYAEQSGALILAEGIETPAHVNTALALGATLGQGWHFGRPAARVDRRAARAELVLPAARMTPVAASPFGALPPGTVLRRSPKRLLIELSKHLEEQAALAGRTAVLASTFQEARHFTPSTADRYGRLASATGLVVALATGLPDQPAPGVRGTDLAPGDPLTREWDVVVAGPQMHVALLARDLGDDGPDMDREFEYALTYRAETVQSALQALIARTVSQDSGLLDRQGLHDPGLVAVTETSTTGGRDDLLPASAMAVMTNRALAASSSGVTIVDMLAPDQPLMFVNAAFEVLSGLDRTDLLGQNCRFLQGEATDPATVARVAAAIAAGRECRETFVNYRMKDGVRVAWWNEVFLSPVHDDTGRVVQYIGVQNDVTARVRTEEAQAREHDLAQRYSSRLESLAFTDPLTGLANRRRIEDRVETGLELATRSAEALGLLYLDLDQFKPVNDSLGHAAGDELLRVVGRRLLDVVRAPDVVARLGGDEFLIAVFGLAAPDADAQLAGLADRVRDAVGQPVELAGTPLTLTASVGHSCAPAEGATFSDLMHLADTRMYRAKRPQAETS